MCWEQAIPTALQIAQGLSGSGQQQSAYSRAQDQYQQQLQSAMGGIQQREGQAVSALQQAGQQSQLQFSPYSLAGKQALDMYKGALGMEGGSTFNPQQSALYQYQLGINTDAMNRQLASRGLAGSAAAMPALAKMTTQLGAEEGTRQMGYLQNMMTTGYNAAGEQARYGYNMGQNVADVYGQTGSSLADLYGKSAQGYLDYGQKSADTAKTASGGIANAIGNFGQNMMYQPYLQAATANQNAQAASFANKSVPRGVISRDLIGNSAPTNYNFGLNPVPSGINLGLGYNANSSKNWNNANVGGW